MARTPGKMRRYQNKWKGEYTREKKWSVYNNETKHIAKNNTVPVILLHENQRLHKHVQKLSSKLERCRASANETERRYEQIRIELAEKCLDLEDSRAIALQKNIRIRCILAGTFAFVFVISLF